MANTRNSSTKNTDIKVFCVCCGNTNQKNFYSSINESHKATGGKLPWCKNCVSDQYDKYLKQYGDSQLAIYYTCRKFDLPFSLSAFNGAKNNSIKVGWNVLQSYFKEINSGIGQANNYGNCFDDTKDNIETIDINNTITNLENSSSFEVTEDTIKYWGKGRQNWEYEYLEDEIFRLKTDFECPDYGMEMIMKDICFINLDIEKIRQGLEKGDIPKLIESRSKLMNDGNLKPVQSTGADKNEKLSLGVFIKKWENERPITKKLDDEMKTYIDTYMAGHLAKMEGLNNDLVRKYEDAIRDYTIDFSVINSEDNEE